MRALVYLEEGSNNGWTLVASNEVSDTTTSDKKTSVEVYADVSTTIGAITYDTVKDAVDGGNVSYAKTAGSTSGNAATSSAVKDYNDSKLTKFGYSTTGMTSTSWLGSWDASTSGEYRLRAITPANAIKSGIGTTAIGKASLPVYWNGNNFVTITSYEGKAATAGVADSANAVAWDNVSGKPSSFTPATHTHTVN
jgi:hypothetical protein